jgi:3-phenylpropionate/trans-cinnamate dioxygenase ferredoxin reductase subunit
VRDEGFSGQLTIIGDEPYDRPLLSKQVLTGVPAEHTKLPRVRAIDADWRLGMAATGLDRAAKQVRLANGEQVPFDRLLIAIGTRARPWFNPTEAALKGVYTLRTRDDAAQLREALAAGPARVLVIGAGFVGSEVASTCRELGLAVTVAELGSAPLVGALGGVIGAIAAQMQRDHGVDLRCGVGGEVPGGRRERTRAAGPPLRRNHGRRRRGSGIAGFDPQHRVAAGGTVALRRKGVLAMLKNRKEVPSGPRRT